MKKLTQLTDGSNKRVWNTDDPNIVILDFKDTMTGYNGLKRCSIRGKGSVNNQITNVLMQILERNGIPTQYVEEISAYETLVKKVRPFPVTVLVRNYAAGTLATRLGLSEGTPMKKPVIEYRSRNHELGDPMINVYHIAAMSWISDSDLKAMTDMSLKINRILTAFCKQINVLLVDLKLEFGLTADGKLILADEISPDSCRFWDIRTHERLDKDRFREDDPDGMVDAYQEILKRVLGD